MKIFISSLIGGFEAERAAVRSAVTTLRHEPVMAEDFGAKPTTPQIACLQGVRSADLFLLVLGGRYGFVQGTSGVSPTEEEFLEAKSRAMPILMFVQDVERDDRQATFVSDASQWQEGHFRASFRTAEELRDQVTRAVHDHELANATAPLDITAVKAAALALLPEGGRNHQAHAPTLHVAVAGGPIQRILRPAQLEAPALEEAIHQQALFGATRLFSRSKGVEAGIQDSALVLVQERGAAIQLDERGGLALSLPLERSEGGRRSAFGMFAVIEEDVMRELATAISFAAWMLDHTDPTQRVTHVALAASIAGSDHLGWRTQAEQDASPNAGTVRMFGGDKLPMSATDRPRAALRHQATEIAEDLMVPLRRQMK